MNLSCLARLAALLVAAAVGAAICAAAYPHHRPPPLLSDMEIGFAQDMSAHHQQAVTMTDMLAADATPDVKALAQQIRFTQLDEIGQMTGWLQLVGAAPASSHPMAWMATPTTSSHHDDHMGVAMTMPGMASADDLSHLQHATGLVNQTLFLQLMTRHHQGGIAMATYAFQHTTNDAIRRAASVMVDEQTQEIQLMAMLLDQQLHPR